MINGKIFLLLCLGLFFNCSRAYTEELPQWQGGFIARVEILALLQTLNAQLLSNRSAKLFCKNGAQIIIWLPYQK